MNKFIIIIFLLLSCTKESEHIVQADILMKNFSKEMLVLEHMKTVGTGGAMRGDIKAINMIFEANKMVAIKEGRRFFLNIISRLCEKMNNNEFIRPYLHDYPCSFNNIELTIRFISEKNTYYEPVATIFNYKGKIGYFSCTKLQDGLKTIHVETYEEAIKELENEQE